MPEPREGLFQPWSRWDTAGLIAVAGLFCPPLGLSILLSVAVYELSKIVASVLSVAWQWVRDVVRGIGQTRRDLAGNLRRWFTPAPRVSLKEPPTSEQQSAAALQRYERTLRLLAKAKLDELELSAARERAKQQYLRDLDRVMQ